jgi:hypothetical protein
MCSSRLTPDNAGSNTVTMFRYNKNVFNSDQYSGSILNNNKVTAPSIPNTFDKTIM